MRILRWRWQTSLAVGLIGVLFLFGAVVNLYQMSAEPSINRSQLPLPSLDKDILAQSFSAVAPVTPAPLAFAPPTQNSAAVITAQTNPASTQFSNSLFTVLNQKPVSRPSKDFAPVLLKDMQRPLPDNQVWIVQTVLLNPTQGTLANPGQWAAPAKLLEGNAHWK